MTPADAREQLEAAVWQQLTAYGFPGLRLPSGRVISAASLQGFVTRVLGAADAYAEQAREAGYADAVARTGHALRRDPGEPPRIVPGSVIREIDAPLTKEEIDRCGWSEDPYHRCRACYDYAAGDYRPTRLTGRPA